MPHTWIIAVSVLVRNSDGKILLVHSPLRQSWELPGGQIEAGEPIMDGVARELREETGIGADVERLGCVHQNLTKSIVVFGFVGRFRAGELRPSAESDRLGWFDLEEANKLAMRPAMQLRIADLMGSGIRLRSYTTDLFEMKSVRDFA